MEFEWKLFHLVVIRLFCMYTISAFVGDPITREVWVHLKNACVHGYGFAGLRRRYSLQLIK